jgi:uncharacterized protein YkwD
MQKNTRRNLLVVGTFLLFTFPASAQAQHMVPSMEYPIISWTNTVRKSYGRGAVAPNPQLTLAARRHAMNMAAQETMSHTLDGTGMPERVKIAGYPYAAVGENVAYNFGYQNPDWKLFESWLNSPGHLQNIMNGQFTEIGVGIARSASGKYYACQVFGRPASMMQPNVNPYQIYGGPPGWMPAPQQPYFNYFYAGTYLE